jgi:hypothetical protein
MEKSAWDLGILDPKEYLPEEQNWGTLRIFHILSTRKTWAADLYLIYKLEPKARVCISDTDRMRMFYRT